MRYFEARYVVVSLIAGAGVADGVGQRALAQSPLAAEIRLDAAARTSRLEDAAAGGWNKKYFLSDATGDNRLEFDTLVQLRAMFGVRQSPDAPPADFEELTHGFETRRVEANANGNVYDKSVTYKVGFEAGASGTFALKDAFVQFKLDNGVKLRAGQFKPPMLREELTSNKFQLTADRSVTNSVFTFGRSQGVDVAYETDDVRVAAMLHDGRNADNTDFTSTREADFALTGRVDYKFAGDWKRFDDFTSWRGSEFAATAGIAAHYQDGGGTFNTADVSVAQITLDGSAEGDGWNAYAAFIFRSTDGAGDTLSDLGFLIQGGYFFTDQLEGFARFDAVVPDDADGADPFNTLTLGANYYVSPSSHTVKLAGDVIYYFDAQSETGGLVAPSTSQALVTDTEGGQASLRLQVQFIF